MAICPKSFYNKLKENEFNFFTGVPDSTLKYLINEIDINNNSQNHIIAANEGNAVAIAAGHYISTNSIPVVYMQNSGLGNAINPIVSLIDRKVYNIPVLFIIGWRGKPGLKDEPQHIKQGEITEDLLSILDIEYSIVNSDEEQIYNDINNIRRYMEESLNSYALIVEPGAFEEIKLFEEKPSTEINNYPTRENSIRCIVDNLRNDDLVVSTTGKISRELYEYRLLTGEGHNKDFLTVGSMGHSSSIALGMANNLKNRIICLDGDGALLMHMGSIPIIGNMDIDNFIHVLLNNGCHESVGGYDTVALDIDIASIAKISGYDEVITIYSLDDLENVLNKYRDFKGKLFIEVLVSKGSRKDLGRPEETPVENKNKIMKFISNMDK